MLCNGITLHGGWCLADLLPGLQTTLLRGPSKNQDLLMCRVLPQLLGKHLFDSIYHVLGDLVIFGLLDLCLSLISILLV